MPTLPIPKAAEECFAELRLSIRQHRDTMVRLERDLDLFPKELKAALERNEFLDTENADYCLAQSKALLALCQQDPDAAHVPDVLAAIDYFVCEADGIDDFEAIDGFEDDRAVIDAVIHHYQLKFK